jgi:hypothetical protein
MDYQEMTFDQWVETYKPVKNHFVEDSCFDGTMFETFSIDAEFVAENIDRKVVWTWIDNNDGEPDYLISGCWRINRLGYFITEVPYNGERGNIAVNF